MHRPNSDGRWMMSGWTKDRWYMLLGALCLLSPFLFPVWVISLTAPQYTEPVKMFIHPNRFSGEIQTINILNHYVGMKEIPEEMLEFTLFPAAIILMIGFGLLCAYLRKYYRAWILLFLILGGIGVLDFYLWEYDYGHHLDPKAPIKIPGQAYQPPLIGAKTILNFRTLSLPTWGSIGVVLSLVLGYAAHLNRKNYA